MSPRSLFDVILKVLGIFFIRDILEALSRFLSVLVYFPQYGTSNEAFFNLGVTIPPILLYSIFAWILLFRTGSVVKILRLEKHFGNDQFNINFQRTVVLSTAVLITGGWLLVTEIPEFFRYAVYYYQERVKYDRMVRPDFSYPVTSLAKILLGAALIIFHTSFVHLIESLSKKRLHGKWRGQKKGSDDPRKKAKRSPADRVSSE